MWDKENNIHKIKKIIDKKCTKWYDTKGRKNEQKTKQSIRSHRSTLWLMVHIWDYSLYSIDNRFAESLDRWIVWLSIFFVNFRCFANLNKYINAVLTANQDDGGANY